MSSSPAAKRNLKPSPIAASTQQPSSQFTAAAELPSVHPAAGNPSPNPTAESFATFPQPTSPGNPRKRKSLVATQEQMTNIAQAQAQAGAGASTETAAEHAGNVDPPAAEPKVKKSRTNTPWTPAEEQRLKKMRDEGHSWSEIAKTFPARTEGSVKKHWYKDMHYAEFGEDESQALFAAIKEYEANKWKVIGQKVGKPAKACEQYAKEHFQGKV